MTEGSAPPKKTPAILPSDGKVAFADREQIRYYFDRILPQLSNYSHTSRSAWVEIMVEHCLAEKNFDAALSDFLTYIQQEGLEIGVDSTHIERSMDKLFQLRYLRKMIHAVGLGFLEEDILREEVIRLYRVRPAEIPLPKPQRKPAT